MTNCTFDGDGEYVRWRDITSDDVSIGDLGEKVECDECKDIRVVRRGGRDD